MKIDNAQLAAFASVLKEGSFEYAARKLNVTPSAISQRVKLLEDRIGHVLIQRTSPCQATAAGRSLLQYVEQISILESEILLELGVGAEISAPIVKVPLAINADSLDSWFPEVLSELASIPSINVDIRSEDQQHSLSLLFEGSVMAVVSSNPLAIQGCSVNRLGTMRYIGVASPDYIEQHISNGVTDQSFLHAPHLIFNKKDKLQQDFFFQLTGSTLETPAHFFPTTKSFEKAIQMGMGWGVLPEQIASEGLANGTLRNFSPENFLDIQLFWHRSKLKSAALDKISALVYKASLQNLRQI